MTTPTVVFQPNQGRLVPLASLWLDHPKWTNPRTLIDDDKLTELGESIKKDGILDPPHVAQVKVNGDIINLVIDGQRRGLAAKRVLPKTAMISVIDIVPEVIEDLTWEVSDQLMLKALTIGSKRESLTSYELTEVADRLRHRNRTGADIARALNKSESWVSRMLKARSTATAKLMASWKRNEITDEQFKELAAEKDQAKQADATKEVAEARKTGDKTEARTRAKEVSESAKRTAPAKPPKVAKANGKPAAEGPQVDLWKEPPPVKPKSTAPSKVVLEEMIGLADKRPPTHDYVKGLMDGVAYALGHKDPGDFGKAWHQYLARLGGTKAPRKARKIRKPARDRKPRANAKAKAKKARR
jgi:ParB/RepB/Spo0J family partition protein